MPETVYYNGVPIKIHKDNRILTVINAGDVELYMKIVRLVKDHVGDSATIKMQQNGLGQDLLIVYPKV